MESEEDKWKSLEEKILGCALKPERILFTEYGFFLLQKIVPFNLVLNRYAWQLPMAEYFWVILASLLGN